MRREALDCGNPLPLSTGSALPERQKTAAVQSRWRSGEPNLSIIFPVTFPRKSFGEGVKAHAFNETTSS